MKYCVMDIMLNDIHFYGTLEECEKWKKKKGLGYIIKPL